MKIVVVGGTGLVGQEIVKQLQAAHEVIAVSRNSADLQVDIEDKASIQALFDKIGPLDAIISAAGDGVMGPFDAEDDAAYERSLNSKIMGQVNLTRIGQKHLTPNGSITLTSGAAAQHPLPHTAAISMGAAAVDAFAATVALELQDGKRINTISLSLVKEAAETYGMDSTGCVPVAKVAQTYVKSALEPLTGQKLPVAA